MRHSFTLLITAALVAPALVPASPMISVDTIDVNAGLLYEGNVSVIKHNFRIKNTGDSVLVIQAVRPG